MTRLAALAIVCCAAWLAWPRVVLSHGSLTTTVLFDREIVRILDNRCVSCHAEGAVSFPLTTYEQTWIRGRDIRTQVLRRHMPPWAAVPGYGQFANDNGLTLRESQFLVSWVEGLGPRNAGNVFLNVATANAVPAAEVRASAHTDHWQLGAPDLTRPLAPSSVAAGEGDVVRRQVVDLGLATATDVGGLEFRPGDRRAVRAATFTLEKTGQWLGSWTPWYGHTSLPSGVAYRLPAGSRVVADVHYRATREAIVDRGTLGLRVADRRPSRAASDIVLRAVRGASAGTLRAATRLTADTFVWALQPEIARGLSSIEVSARTPDGGTRVLLFAKDPRPEWPTPYILQEPVRLRAGTTLSLVARFDGAAAQPGSLRLTVSRY